MNLDKLQEALERQLPNGTYVYDDEKVRELLPALFLLSGKKFDDVKGQAMQELLAEFRAKLGLEAETTEDEFASKLAQHYRTHPPDQQLLREFREACE